MRDLEVSFHATQGCSHAHMKHLCETLYRLFTEKSLVGRRCFLNRQVHYMLIMWRYFGGGCDRCSSSHRGMPVCDETDAGLVQTLPSLEKKTLPAWENPRQAKSWERLHKESGHLSKEWAALSGWARRAIRHKTRASQTGSHWMVPSEKLGLVFQQRGRQRSDDHCPPVCHMSSHWHWLCGTGGRKLFSSEQTKRVISEVRESGRALRHALWTPTLSVRREALFTGLNPRLNHSTFQKQAFQNKWD